MVTLLVWIGFTSVFCLFTFLFFLVLLRYDNFYALKLCYWLEQRSQKKQFQRGYKAAANMTKIGYDKDDTFELVTSCNRKHRRLRYDGAEQFFKDYKAMQDLIDS